MFCFGFFCLKKTSFSTLHQNDNSQSQQLEHNGTLSLNWPVFAIRVGEDLENVWCDMTIKYMFVCFLSVCLCV